MTTTIRPSLSKVKARAKALKKENQIPHMKALELAAQELGYPSYHALDTYLKRLNKNQSDIARKTLIPKLQSSLLVVFNDDLEIRNYKDINGEIITTKENFQTEYLNKGFAEQIGARLVNAEELKQLRLLAPGSMETGDRDYLHEWGYVCIEFLRAKDNPWTIEDADKLVMEKVGKAIGRNYREFFYLDGKLVENHISKEWHAKWDSYNDVDYHPAIDGY
ncbi:hypothetical protein DI392_08690 [Vibrio albus]|uniref:Uncharacterized protein n=1 Tax=Vibrio albus TaxID=2200953 RepID=A0A2U3B9Q1_9VIBR|nr:hypothetical protein [Vibrio albus]PWI33536.1 hypothetical protein DI392_08690 [Vibrio albus]